MKVNVALSVADGEGRHGVLNFQADLSGDMEKELSLYRAVDVETWYELTVSKIEEE